MTTATQQFPSNPALDFAQSILDETNNGLELIEILRDIAEDCDEKANTNDRIAATNILNDRAFGKVPKQLFHSQDPVPDPAPETDDNDVDPAPYSIRGAFRESPPAASHEEPESPRLVSQINGALHKSLGPTPTAPQSTEPFDPNSIHFTIQQHILAITNNGQTLRDILLEIARAEDNPRVTPYHRRRAVILLIDRSLGTDPTPVLRPSRNDPNWVKVSRTTLSIPPATSLTRPRAASSAAPASTCTKGTKESIASTTRGLPNPSRRSIA